jgi:hypothetical protein
MDRTDKILLGTCVPLMVAIVVVAVVLLITTHPCPPGSLWDRRVKACRSKCPGEHSASGQRYNYETNTCACPDDVAPTWDPIKQQCVGSCDAGEEWDADGKRCVPSAVECTPLPAVNSMTGMVSDASHFPRPGGQCGDGTRDELDALCVASECTSDTCRPGDRWDGYSAPTGACYKRAVCGMIDCDAPYCVTDTVKAQLGRLVKVDAGEKCVNPSADTVAELCKALAHSRWAEPQCYDTAVLSDVNVSVTQADLSKAIEGVVQHELVNGVQDLDGQGKVRYTYTLATASGAVVEAGEGVVVQACATPPANRDAVCYNFSIQPPDVPEGVYMFSLTGYPSWDPSLALYQQSAPVNIHLQQGTPDPTALPQLAVNFSSDKAAQVARDANLVNQKLAQLKGRSAAGDSITPVAEALPVAANPGAKLPLVVDCRAGYCAVNQVINSKLVVLAWDALPATLDVPSCSDTAVVKYYLARSLASKGVVESPPLIGPTLGQNQPLPAEVSSGTISFFDWVEVGDTVTYFLGAYLAPTADSTVEFKDATCHGQLQQVAVFVPPYTAASCHEIKTGRADAIPPYLSVTKNGACSYDASQASQDFYCLYGQNNGFDVNNLALAEGGACYPFEITYPVLDPKFSKTEWTPYAQEASTESCITGISQTVAVTCHDKMKLAKLTKEFTKSELQTRLNDVVANFDRYSYSPSFDPNPIYVKCANSTDPDCKATTDAATQKLDALFNTYVPCGPRDSSKKYGRDEQTCADGDTACTDIGAGSNCQYNTCNDWVRQPGSANQYTMSRKLFYNEASEDARAKCCFDHGDYSRGQCTCTRVCDPTLIDVYDGGCLTYGGVQCNLLPPRDDPIHLQFKTPEEATSSFPGIYKPKQNQYVLIRVGNIANSEYRAVQFTSGSGHPDTVMRQSFQVDLGGGSGKDEVVVSLVLLEGDLRAITPSTRATFDAIPLPIAKNGILYANKKAERKTGAYMWIDGFTACVKPRTMYTLALCLLFEKGVGTDDIVFAITPAYINYLLGSNSGVVQSFVQTTCDK